MLFNWLRNKFRNLNQQHKQMHAQCWPEYSQIDSLEQSADPIKMLGAAMGYPLPMTYLVDRCRWMDIRARHVKKWVQKGNANARVWLGIASLNRNGYIRQQAIESMGQTPRPDMVPFVLWGLKDWVFEVRQASEQALDAMLTVENAHAFLMQYRLIHQLGAVERVDCRPVQQKILDFMVANLTSEQVARALKAHDSQKRLFAYRLFADRLPTDRQLQELAANDPEQSIRAWFASQINRFEPSVYEYWMYRLLRDSSTMVACQLIRNLDDQNKAHYEDALLEAGFSDSRPIRNAARFALRDRVSRQAWAEHYRDKLDVDDIGKVHHGWVAGLGDTGTPDDIPRLVPYLSSTRAKLRSAALRAISSLDRDIASEYLILALKDTSRRVQRVTSDVFAERMVPNEKEALYRMMQQSKSESTQLACLHVIAELRLWDAVPCILMGASSQYLSVKNMSWRRGATWLKYHGASQWSKPTASILPFLKMSFDQCVIDEMMIPKQYRDHWMQMYVWTRKVIQ